MPRPRGEDRGAAASSSGAEEGRRAVPPRTVRVPRGAVLDLARASCRGGGEVRGAGGDDAGGRVRPARAADLGPLPGTRCRSAPLKLAGAPFERRPQTDAAPEAGGRRAGRCAGRGRRGARAWDARRRRRAEEARGDPGARRPRPPRPPQSRQRRSAASFRVCLLRALAPASPSGPQLRLPGPAHVTRSPAPRTEARALPGPGCRLPPAPPAVAHLLRAGLCRPRRHCRRGPRSAPSQLWPRPGPHLGKSSREAAGLGLTAAPLDRLPLQPDGTRSGSGGSGPGYRCAQCPGRAGLGEGRSRGSTRGRLGRGLGEKFPSRQREVR